jgi:hypothetical protein
MAESLWTFPFKWSWARWSPRGGPAPLPHQSHREEPGRHESGTPGPRLRLDHAPSVLAASLTGAGRHLDAHHLERTTRSDDPVLVLLERPFRWSHVAPPTAPSTMTAPMAMNQVSRLKTTPIVP